jgi:hypothetical protein
MAMSMGGSGASAPQMNVTPLIDVLARADHHLYGDRRQAEKELPSV